MPNEERIYRLCEYIMDLIDEFQYYDEKLYKNTLWIKNEIDSIRKDIDNN